MGKSDLVLSVCGYWNERCPDRPMADPSHCVVGDGVVGLFDRGGVPLAWGKFVEGSDGEMSFSPQYGPNTGWGQGSVWDGLRYTTI